MTPDIEFYCGIGDTSWNHHPIDCGPYACVSPVYGRDASRNKVRVPEGTLVIQDAGPYSDGEENRLDPADALQRQKDHARYYHYEHAITHRASYDMFIKKLSPEASKFAVKTTIDAAAYLDAHRSPGIGCVMSAQGLTAEQYIECAIKILPYIDVEQDIFGLGGWSQIGKIPSMLKVFRPTMEGLIPILAINKIRWVHVWGMCFPEALAILLELCEMYGIKLTTDSMGPAQNPVFGQWGYGSWRDNNYSIPTIMESCRRMSPGGYKALSCAPGTRCKGLERARHVRLTREWLANFREREAHLFEAFQGKDEKYQEDCEYYQLQLEEATA